MIADLLSRYHCITLAGSGGKTSLLYALVRECKGKTLASTTTKMYVPGNPEKKVFDIVEQCDTLPEGSSYPQNCRLFAWNSVIGNSASMKVIGFSRKEFANIRGWDNIIIEADGARGLPLKAQGTEEPVIPENADLCLYVIGGDALFRPYSRQNVFRPELFEHITGIRHNQVFSDKHLLRLVMAEHGIMRNIPRNLPVILVINKADLMVPEIDKKLLRSTLEEAQSRLLAVWFTSCSGAPDYSITTY